MAMATATALTLAGLAATGATGLGSAKMQSGAAGRAARLQTDAANRAAELQSQTAADQLAYVRNQARMDRESSDGRIDRITDCREPRA